MNTRVIMEKPLAILRSSFCDFRGGEGDEIEIYAKDFAKAEVGTTWCADDTCGCGRGNNCESLKVVYKDDRGVAAVYHNWGTTNEDNPKDWEGEPELWWFELVM